MGISTSLEIRKACLHKGLAGGEAKLVLTPKGRGLSVTISRAHHNSQVIMGIKITPSFFYFFIQSKETRLIFFYRFVFRKIGAGILNNGLGVLNNLSIEYFLLFLLSMNIF
ncbi:hypothetical protein HW132_34585 [Brasilonema sp. CT11]|nr:hypothetical protein [Brasilonema sp. CT11]